MINLWIGKDAYQRKDNQCGYGFKRYLHGLAKILKDSISPGQLVPGLEIVDGHIHVDREMKCNIPGCFAAGDCVGKPYQYIKSAGEGNIAALSAVKYIDTLKMK